MLCMEGMSVLKCNVSNQCFQKRPLITTCFLKCGSVWNSIYMRVVFLKGNLPKILKKKSHP